MPRQIFIDDCGISHLRNVERRAHVGERHALNPLLTRHFPWEQSRVQIYGRSVIHDAEPKKYRMYYIAQAGPSQFDTNEVNGQTLPQHATLPAYAESEDGIHWERPVLGQRSFNGINETNLLDFNRGMSFEAGVLHDPHDPDPARRYKLFYWDQKAMLMPHGRLVYQGWGDNSLATVLNDNDEVIYSEPYNDWGLDVAFSPDGVHWTRHPEPVLHCYSDTGQSVLYDERLQRYVAFGRFNLSKPRGGGIFNLGRGVARMTSDDFIHWSDPEPVLCADEGDPAGFQINSMPIDLYEGLYVGLLENFVQGVSATHCGPLQLACSRDGGQWTRVADRFEFLPPGEKGAWDDIGVRPGSAIVPIGDDRIGIYYCSGRRGESFCAGIGLATWRRDGFVSLHAGPEGGEVLTRQTYINGPRLYLNLAAADGEAQVQICDVQGRPFPDHEAPATVRGDATALAADFPFAFTDIVGTTVTLRITLRNADLFSYWFA
jgi:hypothetical protein